MILSEPVKADCPFVSVPGATAESIGVSDDSRRDESIAGDGRPWLMLAGQPGAHIMIPINK